MKPYAVFTPDWSNYSAGVLVLHTLAHKLQEQGCKVYTNAGKQNPNWKHIPLMHEFDGNKKDLIGIYPEIVTGNPFGSGKIVRYLLHLPGFFGGPKTFDKTDLLFSHSRFFNQRLNLPEERVLFFPYLNTSIFYDMKMQRKYDYYYTREEKGGRYPDERIKHLPFIGSGKENDGINGQKNLALKLNRANILYCYDNVTAMTDIARLCGCAVILIPDGFWSEEECKKLVGWEIGGMSYGIENKKIALESINAEVMKHHYTIELEEKGKQALNKFIEITQR